MTSMVLRMAAPAKGITVVYGSRLPVLQSTSQPVESFQWSSQETEEQATGRAATHLQKHYAPHGVRVIAVPGYEWLKPVDVMVDGKVYTIRRGKTDIVFYAENAASSAMLNDLAAQLNDRYTRAAQQRVEPRDVFQPQSSSRKRRQELQIPDASSEDDAVELANNDAAKHQIDRLLERLIFFVVGVYEVKPPEQLARKLQRFKRQAGAEHLQLAFTVGMLRQNRHPGCLVVLGDLKSNYIWEALLPADLSKPVDQIDAPEDETQRTQAITFIRRSLRKLASCPAMLTINCHHAEPSPDNDTDEDEEAPRDPHQPGSHQQSGRQAAQPSDRANEEQRSSSSGPAGGSRRHHAGPSDDHDIGDEDRLLHALHRAALTQYFADPAVYRAFGCKQPMAPPFMALDRWSASLGAHD